MVVSLPTIGVLCFGSTSSEFYKPAIRFLWRRHHGRIFPSQFANRALHRYARSYPPTTLHVVLRRKVPCRKCQISQVERDFPGSGSLEGSVLSLQKNTPFRMVLFLFGAFHQAVTLYAVRGPSLIGTKIVGSMYLSSFKQNWLAILLGFVTYAAL